MSERITHTAVLDDCFRLMQACDFVGEEFKLTARGHHELARLASATRWGDKFMAPMLDRMRGEWANRTPEMKLEPRMAYVLGWLCHRAADKQMKPVFRSADAGSKLDPTDCSVYHDAFTYREVYLNKAGSPYDAMTLGIENPPDRAQWETLRELFHTVMQQSLIELHTFIPDPENGWGWVDKIEKLRQDFYVNIDRYAKAVAEPDPEKTRRYITETKFYLPGDPLIQLARRIQGGKICDAKAVSDAFSAPQESQYGQALQKGLRYLKAAYQFFRGTINEAEFKQQLA